MNLYFLKKKNNIVHRSGPFKHLVCNLYYTNLLIKQSPEQRQRNEEYQHPEEGLNVIN